MMAGSKTLPPGVSPRGLNVDQAAAYFGLSNSGFRKLVARGVVKPIDLDGFARCIFDREALDAVISARAQQQTTGAEQ
jgi:hypothetical protein